MMCEPCKKAGRTLTNGISASAVRFGGFRSARDAIDSMHRECRGTQLRDPSQCTCQHVTESVLASPKVTG